MGKNLRTLWPFSNIHVQYTSLAVLSCRLTDKCIVKVIAVYAEQNRPDI